MHTKPASLPHGAPTLLKVHVDTTFCASMSARKSWLGFSGVSKFILVSLLVSMQREGVR